MPDLTATIGQRIAARGVDVTDIRSKLKRNGSYDRLPNSRWMHTAVHYTAATRTPRSLAGDIESWQGHARHHVNTNRWPAIAYAIGASMAGRVFLLRDIEEMGYHAFNANGSSIGVSADMGVQAATPALLEALVRVLTVLHDETPELPNLVRERTFGHKELTFLDARNITDCPGSLLPWVQAYRVGKPVPGPDPINQAFDAYRARHSYVGLPIYRGHIDERAHWGGEPLPVLRCERAMLAHINGEVVNITAHLMDEAQTALGNRLVKYGGA